MGFLIYIFKGLVVITYPITFAVEKIHVVPALTRPIVQTAGNVRHAVRSKKTVKIGIGICFILTGSFMATHPVLFVPHALWDAFSYSLHGYGSLPILKVFCKKLIDLEDLDDGEKKKETVEAYSI